VGQSLKCRTQLVNIPDGAAIDAAGRWHAHILDLRAKLAHRNADCRSSLELSEPEYHWQKWHHVNTCGRASHGLYSITASFLAISRHRSRSETPINADGRFHVRTQQKAGEADWRCDVLKTTHVSAST
jgi:hypothetical protein